MGLYTSLCQYFSEKEMMWRTEGLVPLEETSPSQAVCLTRHLTAFGASLFVPPSHIHFIFPVSAAVFLGGSGSPAPLLEGAGGLCLLGLTALCPQEPVLGMNYIVLLTCAVCLVTYAVMAVVLRKLDQLDVSRVRVIPFCGKGGRFKYEIDRPRRPDLLEGCPSPTPLHPHPPVACCAAPPPGWEDPRQTHLCFHVDPPISPVPQAELLAHFTDEVAERWEFVQGHWADQ